MIKRRSFSIRAKLTLWYFAATFVGLCIFGLASFGALRHTLTHLKRASLIRREQRLLLFLQQNRNANESLDEQLENYAVITHEGNLFQIRDLNGALLFPTNQRSPSWLSRPQTECSQPVFNDIEVNAQPTFVMCHDATIDGRRIRLYIGGSLEDNTYILSTYRNSLLLLLPCLMIIAAMSGYFLSRRAMDPVSRMTRAAVEISIGNLSARLPEPAAHDELWSLAVAWNELLDRLEAAVTRLTKFSADASHDLRTSITVMLATAELALHRRRSEQEYQESLRRVVNECRTASSLLDALLSLARSDNFVHEVAIKHINMVDLTVAACRRVEDLAESSGIILDWRLPEEDLYVEGDELLLKRLLGILLDNAIKYTPESGEIVVDVCAVGSEVVLTVHDTGVGMSEQVQQQIFDRFYQEDFRDRKDKVGSGLGLSIAKWIAEAHRATLSVNSAPTHGSKFQVRFPFGAPVGQASNARSKHLVTL